MTYLLERTGRIARLWNGCEEEYQPDILSREEALRLARRLEQIAHKLPSEEEITQADTIVRAILRLCMPDLKPLMIAGYADAFRFPIGIAVTEFKKAEMPAT